MTKNYIQTSLLAIGLLTTTFSLEQPADAMSCMCYYNQDKPTCYNDLPDASCQELVSKSHVCTNVEFDPEGICPAS